MAQKVPALKSSSNGLGQFFKDVDNLLTQDSGLLCSKHLSSAEVEIITKISAIENCLKTLEENFSRTRQDLLKKSTLEGRENNKICAVQGKIISNTKNYYKTLEEDINLLSNTFHDNFQKIVKELDSIHILSKAKPNYKKGSSGENYNESAHRQDHMSTSAPLSLIRAQKLSGLAALKPPQTNFLKMSTPLKEKKIIPFVLKTDPAQEIPKKLDFMESQAMRPQVLNVPTINCTPQKFIVSQILENKFNRNRLDRDILVPRAQHELPIEDSSFEMEVAREDLGYKRHSTTVGQNADFSSREDNPDAVFSRKSRFRDSFLTGDRKEASLDTAQNFYI